MGTEKGLAGQPHAAQAPPAEPAYRYAAFISYRHAPADRRWAVWLHRSLEAYRVPKRLRRERGLPPRVGRCFRDEEELPASSDLSREIDSALEQSRLLIVVCSPRAPQSEWVNREVERFREMGRHDRILALLIEGEPAESFPRALREIRRTVSDAHGLTREQVEQVEPLAADVRPSRLTSRGHLGRMAKLRILAQVLGVPFDDLRQRDQERRTRQLAALSGGLVALLAVFAAVAALAVRQTGEANRQRAAAEASALDARRRLVDLYTRNGWSRVEAGDSFVGLLWFVRALETAAGDPAAEADARVSIATTLAASPRLLDARPDLTWDKVTHAGRSLQKSNVEVRIIDTATGRLVAPPLRHEDSVNSATFSPDGRMVATASADGTARVWDAATGQPLTPPLRHEGDVRYAEFSPDGRRVVTEAQNSSGPRAWDAATGQPLGSGPPYLSRPRGGGASARWTRGDSRKEVSFERDRNEVRVVTIGTAGGYTHVTSLAPSLRHEDTVNYTAFGPDGRMVVTASADRTARVWDGATGQPLTPPLRHEGDVRYAEFSPDGRRVVTTCADNTARVWDVGPDDRPVGDLRALAVLLACHSLSRAGGLESWNPNEWRDQWEDVRSRHPADFRPRPDWAYEAMGLPATRPATTPATGPAARPRGGSAR